MKTVFCILLLLFAIVLRAPAEPNPEGLALGAQVYRIFEAKCLDCHGAQLPRPKGKFGHVLDLQRVADNEDWVVRGEGAESELYKLVLSDEMPGEDADVPPLTPSEKDVVKRWIDLGAPAPVAVAVAATAAAEPLRKEMPFWKRALRWIGRFHPVSTHFPVALMFVAVFAEGIAWWTRRESMMETVRFLVVLAAAGALVTAGLGWINGWFASYVGESAAILGWHRWLGTAAAAWACVCGVLVMLSECEEGSPERQRLRGALLLGAALIGISGFLGSALIYGLDHYSWN